MKHSPLRLTRLFSMHCASAILLSGSAAAGQMQRLELTDLVLDTIAVVDAGFTIPTDFALGPDGSLLIVDAGLTEVIRIDTAGSVVWRRGREGWRPGEFVLPYRVGFDGTAIHVLDMSGQLISRFTTEGQFISRYRLPFQFLQIDALVPFADGHLAVSGVADTPPPVGERAVHWFDADHEHVQSHGALPPARDPRKGARWGAGALIRDGDGLMYTRRLPYEIWRFDLRRREIERISVPFQFRYEVDDYIEIRETGTEIEFQTLRTAMEAPVNAFPLHTGAIAATRIDETGRYLDLIAADRRSVRSVRLSNEWKAVVAVASNGQLIWALGNDGSEYVLLALRVRGLVNP